MDLSAPIPFFSGISFLDKLLFVKHLSMLLRSGITILEALQILSSQAKSTVWRKVILEIIAEIQNGSTLAKALAKHPRVFDSFFVGIIAVGEDSGTLDESLTYLSTHLSKEYALKKKIQNALMYPSLVVGLALLAGFGMMIYVMPKLLDLFTGFNVQLPLITRIFIAVATFFQQYGIVTLVGMVLVIIGVRILSFQIFFKKIFDFIMLSLPLAGPILQNVSLTNMCRDIGIMMKSGLPVTQAIRIASQMTKQTVFQGYLTRLLSAVERGKSLSQELESSHYRFIPLIASKMIAVGEKTGKLDETLLYLADFFEGEVDDATKNITTVLEPILLLIVGLFVAFVALSIITPIYELTGSIQR